MAAYEFGFLGVGNMGGALAQAAVKALPGTKIAVSSRTAEKAEAFARHLGCTALDNRTLAAQSRFLFLGVKPQGMPGVLAEIAPILARRRDGFCLVSMAAGLTLDRLGTLAGGNYPMIRMMPNTPVGVGAGMILYTANDLVTEETLRDFLAGMSCAGSFDCLPEGLMDAGSAVSGCGPAFACLFLEALADGGVACGLPRAKAQAYAAQTLLGTARMVLSSGEHPGALKDAVCSPGGSTIQGVRVLEERGIRAAAMVAVIAAFDKTKALGK